MLASQGWKLQPEGAKRALSITRVSVSRSTGLSRNERTERRLVTASVTVMVTIQSSSNSPASCSIIVPPSCSASMIVTARLVIAGHIMADADGDQLHGLRVSIQSITCADAVPDRHRC
jgi:hypothetical protein